MSSVSVKDSKLEVWLSRLFFLQHKMEREWILSVLEEGISDGHCFELCDQQGIFQTLLGFSSSPLCDEHSQVHTVGFIMLHISRWILNYVTKEMNNSTKLSWKLTNKWGDWCSEVHFRVQINRIFMCIYNVHLFLMYLSPGTDYKGVVPGRSCKQSSL